MNQEYNSSDATKKQDQIGLNLCDIEYIRQLYDAGHHILPLGRNKAQINKWNKEDGKHVRILWEHLEAYYSTTEAGIGLLCGIDGLGVLDIEEEAYFEQLPTCIEIEYPGLLATLPIVETPSGGIHVYYRCEELEGSKKLARWDTGDVDKNGKKIIETRIETREIGAYAAIPGSALSTHPDNKPYILRQGDLCNIPYITPAQREWMHDWSRESWNEYIEPAYIAGEPTSDPGNPALPSNIFASRHSWEDILTEAGWSGSGTKWTRPGKRQGDGHSATLNHDGRDRLHIFSSSCAPLTEGYSYTKAQFTCLVKFAGDWPAFIASIAPKIVADPTDKLCDSSEFCSKIQTPNDEIKEQKKKEDESFTEKAAELVAQQVQKAAEFSQRRKRVAFTLDELEKRPIPKYAIDKHFTTDGLTVLYGPASSYKSFVALDWAYCLATGKDYLGKFPVVQGPVVYIVSEGSFLFMTRARAWLNHHNHKSTKDIVFVPASFNFQEESEATELLQLAHEKLGTMPKYAIVDTLSRNFGVGDPDRGADMSKFVATLDYIKEQIPCVVCIHHTGWNEERERNSKVLRDATDSMISIARKDTLYAKLTHIKAKDGPEFPPYWIEGSIVPVKPDGEPLERDSLVFDFFKSGKDFENEKQVTKEESGFVKIANFLSSDPAQAISVKNLKEMMGGDKQTIYDLVNEATDNGWLIKIDSHKKNIGYAFYLSALGSQIALKYGCTTTV